jgi:hypothetical protein
MTSTPLAVLDLVPVSAGSTAARALRNSLDLARQAEQAGYARYWFAEHHLSPGVAGTSPAVMIALTAEATSTIRLGSGAVQMGHRTALATVEEDAHIRPAQPGRRLECGPVPGHSPVRRYAQAGGRQARAAAGRHGNRRADRHHDHVQAR